MTHYKWDTSGRMWCGDACPAPSRQYLRNLCSNMTRALPHCPTNREKGLKIIQRLTQHTGVHKILGILLPIYSYHNPPTQAPQEHTQTPRIQRHVQIRLVVLPSTKYRIEARAAQAMLGSPQKFGNIPAYLLVSQPTYAHSRKRAHTAHPAPCFEVRVRFGQPEFGRRSAPKNFTCSILMR